MKNASWSVFLFIVAALLASESFAQGRGNGNGNGRRPDPLPTPVPLPGPHRPGPQQEQIQARIQQTIGRGQVLRLSQFLYARERGVEVLSLTIQGQSLGRGGSLQVLSRGSLIEVLQLTRQPIQLSVRAQRLGELEDLELSSIDEVHIESVTALVSSRHQEPDYGREIQVSPHTLLTVRVNQDVVNGEVPLKKLIKEQLGLSVEGAQIERVAVEGMAIGRAAPALHVEINNRMASQVKYLNAARVRTPIQVNSLEEIRGSLRLVVSGPARILDVNIRIGAVRPQYNPIPGPGPIPQPIPMPTRLLVNQELSPSYPLDLAVFTRELGQARILTLETQIRSNFAGEITLMSRYGHIVGRAQAMQGRTVIYLSQPTVLSEIRIYSQSPVRVGQIEAELERFGRN